MAQYSRYKGVAIIVCFFAVLLLSLTQCKSDSSTVTGGLAEIDVSQKYPEKKLYIQDLAKVEYIPLETNNNTLMRFRSDVIAYVSDDYIIAENYNDGDVFVFDGKGKSKFSFNHKGQGPTDYNVLWSIAFDEKAKEIFVFDLYSKKILVYNEDGKYKRTLTISSDLQDIKMYSFDDETLLVYDNSGIFGLNHFQAGYSKKPYLFMSKEDGSVVDTVNIQLPSRVTNTVAWPGGEENGQSMVYSRGLSINNNRSDGKNFLIADWSCDTVYRLTQEKELQPIIVRKPPLESKDQTFIIITNVFASDKFILLYKIEMNYQTLRNGGDIPQKGLMYDFETGHINEWKLIDKNFESYRGMEVWEAITPENTCFRLLNVAQLFDESEKITGELKELLKSLEEEDNPVLMKIKF